MKIKSNISIPVDHKTKAVVERELRKLTLYQMERQNISKKSLRKHTRDWWPW